MSLNDKIKTLIQFANASRSISYKQSLPYDLAKGRISLLIVANDASENTISKIVPINCKIKKILLFTKGELGEILSKDSVSLIGIKDKNIAKGIMKYINENKKEELYEEK